MLGVSPHASTLFVALPGSSQLQQVPPRFRGAPRAGGGEERRPLRAGLQGAAGLALAAAASHRLLCRRRRRGAAAAAARRRAAAAVGLGEAAAGLAFAGATRAAAAPAALGLEWERIARFAGRAGGVDAAIAIGKNADKMRRKRMSPQDKKKLRAQEIKRKVDILKGRAGARYLKKRDQAKGDGKAKDQGAVEDEGDEGERSGAEGQQRQQEDESGEAEARWAFKRTQTMRTAVRGQEQVSESARAVAAAELAGGTGGGASSRQLLEAAEEFAMAREFEQAIELAEAARPRIDREQLDRKVDAATALQLDDRALWQLAEAYNAVDRLTQSMDTYGTLKDRLLDKKDQKLAEGLWAKVGLKLGERLYNVRRMDEALQVFQLVTDTTTKNVAGDSVFEEVELYTAMTLQQLGRVDEAKEVLQDVRRNTYSKKTKAQASFVLDVFSVETVTRNEEFHKMWDANFELPKDSFRSQTRVGSGAVLNLSDREREWRDWSSKYWEDRLKSPAYYLFLTLWVTWPFAIPVISVLKKMEVAP